MQVHSGKFGDSMAANGSDGGGDGGGDDPNEIRKMIDTMMRISRNKSMPAQQFQNLANWIKNSKSFPCLSAQQQDFFWALQKNRIDANMMTQDIPEWQQAQMQNVSCLASSSEQADMQAAADAAQEMMDADVAAAAERYAKSMRDIRLNMQQKAMQNIDDEIATKQKQTEGEVIFLQAKRQKLESDFASESEIKKRKEKEEHDKAMTKLRECREAKEAKAAEDAKAKAAEDAKRKKDEATNTMAAEEARQKDNADYFGPNGKLARTLDALYKCWNDAKRNNSALLADHPDKAAAVWAESQARSALDSFQGIKPPPEITSWVTSKGPPPQPPLHMAKPLQTALLPKPPAFLPPGMPPMFEPPAPPVPEHDNWDEPKWWLHQWGEFQGSQPHNACNSPVGDDTKTNVWALLDNQTSGWPKQGQKCLTSHKDPRMQILDWTNTGRSDFLIEIYWPSRPSPFWGRLHGRIHCLREFVLNSLYPNTRRLDRISRGGFMTPDSNSGMGSAKMIFNCTDCRKG